MTTKEQQDKLKEAINIITLVKADAQQKYDEMNEDQQEGDSGCELEEFTENCQTALDALEDIT